MDKAVVQYETINLDILYTIITQHLDDFRQYAAAVVQWMERESA